MTENMINIIRAEKSLDKLSEETRKRKAELITQMRKAEEKTANLTEEEICEMARTEEFKNLPLIEKQFMAAKTWGISYLEYRMLMDDIYEDEDVIDIASPAKGDWMASAVIE